MPKFIYVRAVVDARLAQEADPGAISFEHTLVEAADSDDAYDKGHYALGAPALSQDQDDFANDYVVEVQ